MCQIVWIQIKPDIFSGMIWVQIICKSYQLGDIDKVGKGTLLAEENTNSYLKRHLAP